MNNTPAARIPALRADLQALRQDLPKLRALARDARARGDAGGYATLREIVHAATADAAAIEAALDTLEDAPHG